MMFVVKGVMNLSDSTKGELAFVSYQNTQGDHNMSFFYNISITITLEKFKLS